MKKINSVSKYNFKAIERKWQKRWERDKTFQPDMARAKKPFYNLMMFPYPSAEGLHVGNMYAFTGADTLGRYKKLCGHDVFEPIGLDGFGIHSENYAMKIGEHIKIVSERSEKNFYKQLRGIGNMYDWSRTVETYKPDYYQWTQWLFLQMFKNGLAYQKKAKVNWCPSCKTVLSDEQVIQGQCERCDSLVEKRELKQWFFRITKYADKLLKNLEWIDWPEDIKTNQRNWIGRSEGTAISFPVVVSARAGIREAKKVILMHGKNTDPTQKWYPWLAKEVKKQGIKFIAPILPKADDPNVNAWMEEINKTRPNEDTILIGHSRGGAAILRWLEQLPKNKKIKKIILIAANSGDSEKRNKTENNRGFFTKEGYNFEKIKEHCDDFAVFHSRDDKWVPFEAGKENTKGLNAKLYAFNNKGHFGKALKDNKITKLLDEIIPRESKFSPYHSAASLEVFTTRPDTLFGATYMVIAPEHSLIRNLRSKIRNYSEVERYVKKAIGRSEQDRKNDERNKTGIELKGIKAINPVTEKPIPIWVADYVLAGYGTGAIMAVPAHDQRDWEFAKKFGLEIKCVVDPGDHRLAGKNIQEDPQKVSEEILNGERCYEWSGEAMNSGQFNGLETIEFQKEITKWLVKNKLGKRAVDFKLRDWCISRQRYWGPPIPIVWCRKCALDKMPKDKKPKVLIIHGFEGSSKGNWFPWIKKEFEKMGCEVFAPDISSSFHPNIETWMKDLKPLIRKLNRNSVIIGHSLGSKAAMHLLERTDGKVAKVFFVASAIGNPRRNWKAMEKMLAGSDIRSLKEFWEHKVRWDKVNDSFDEAHFIISSDDKFIDPKHYKIAKLDNIYVETWKGQGHFTQSKNEMLRDYIFEKTFTNVEAVPIPEKDLPMKLPPMEDFLPEGKGKGPLAKNEKFVNVKCPVCGKPAKRETDVSDPFVDSSWYFLRYPSTEFDDRPFDKKRTKKWLPIDSYIGGKEHTVLHLLYSRFITMALKDLGHVDFEEPYKRFFGHGLITKDGAKMSKSKGNVVNPDDMIDKYGADTLRLYLRFVGDFGQGGDWRDSGAEGMNKFIRRMWTVFFEITGQGNGVKNISMVDKTIKIVGEDIESLSFNTAVARLMEYVNWLRESRSLFDEAQAKKVKETLSFVIAPMAPHIAEEMWEILGNKTSIFTHRWPKYDKNNIIDEEIELVIQINGKVRDRLKVSRDISEKEAKSSALESEKAQKYINGKKIKRIIYVPGKLVSVVV